MDRLYTQRIDDPNLDLIQFEDVAKKEWEANKQLLTRRYTQEPTRTDLSLIKGIRAIGYLKNEKKLVDEINSIELGSATSITLTQIPEAIAL